MGQIAAIKEKADKDVANIKEKAAAKLKAVQSACSRPAATPASILSVAFEELSAQESFTTSDLAFLQLTESPDEQASKQAAAIGKETPLDDAPAAVVRLEY